MVWYGILGYGMVWYGMVWYVRVWYHYTSQTVPTPTQLIPLPQDLIHGRLNGHCLSQVHTKYEKKGETFFGRIKY